MKTPSIRAFLLTIGSLFAAFLAFTPQARAQITGINAPASSALIKFNDTASLDPLLNPGVSLITQSAGPWPAFSTLALPFTTDIVTNDTAQGDITATWAPGAYNVAINNVLLTQAPLNTGFATLLFSFTVEYQIGGGGLGILPTSSPAFNVSGTVQPPPPLTNFASITGSVNYFAVDAAGVGGLVETVNYNTMFNTPGPFVGAVSGTPVNGNTPAIGPNSTLTLVGNITFTVDPASISANTVPEPSSALLALLSLPLLLARPRPLGASRS